MANLYRVRYTRVWREPSKKFGTDSQSGVALVSATTEANATAATKTAEAHGSDSNWEYTFQVETLMNNILTGS